MRLLAAVLSVLSACAGSAPVPRAAEAHEPRIEVVIAPGLDDAAHAPLVNEWIANARRSIEGYYGAFPVDDLRILVDVGSARGISSGVTRLQDEPTIRIAVSPGTRESAFARDWTMTHEMVHLTLPQLPPAHDWLGEGTAVYVELLARARAGLVDEDAVWLEMLRDFDQGLPSGRDRGLDLDHSWGRTYYGGALFCLLADVEIRARTDNAKSLRDALRAVLSEIGSLENVTTIERVFEIGDRATGTRVLSELYEHSKAAPFPKELASTWARLGVRIVRGRVVRDDGAPLAHVRRALVLGTQ